MARARNIKPGFFKNEELAECTPWARLCFAGLWLLADREGRLEDRPKRIKAELFAFDAFDVDPLLNELAARRFIVRYEIDGSRFIQISKFLEHQTPHYSEKASVIKPPPLQEKRVDQPGAASESTPRKEPPSRGGQNPLNPSSLNPDSPNPSSPIPDSPKEKAARKRAAPAPKPTPKATLDADELHAMGVDRQHASDWLAVRKAKDLPLTRTAWDQTVAEAAKAGVTPAEAVRLSAANGWAGFRATWLANRDAPAPRATGAATPDTAARNAEAMRLLFGDREAPPNPPTEVLDA